MCITSQANTTFEELYRLKKIADDWLEISPNVSKYLATSPNVEAVRVCHFLLSKYVQYCIFSFSLIIIHMMYMYLHFYLECINIRFFLKVIGYKLMIKRYAFAT